MRTKTSTPSMMMLVSIVWIVLLVYSVVGGTFSLHDWVAAPFDGVKITQVAILAAIVIGVIRKI